MSHMMLISDAAKAVNVENHVLRYWEEELRLPIKRNELGHRYYTEEDVERFKQIKSMKERGLQLKAIKMILRDGKIDVLPSDENIGEADTQESSKGREREQAQESSEVPHMAIEIVEKDSIGTPTGENVHHGEMTASTLSKEEKSKRLQWLLQQLIRETLVENNEQLCNDIKESVVKELDYQFRLQEERDEERSKQEVERSEEYYRKMDELLRGKASGKKQAKTEKTDKEGKTDKTDEPDKLRSKDKAGVQKKKRHFIF